ncbi:MAG TPA: 2-oxoglutarate dehydrogenase E1 component [Bacteroidales bacterium]|nr:MAG: 2-oxoglutarate dehydrogenase E1 component [Bacteroidetes bacterium GWF2_33_38]HBF89192.1 2-oxoglutarate dehydrogenase E1 component [Bacteroidales bacterium]
MDKFSFLSNLDYVNQLYNNYQEDKNSVDESWQLFFQGFEFAQQNYSIKFSDKQVDKEFKVINLINGYRQRGHFFTKTNPVRKRRQYLPTLAIENFSLDKADLNTVFQAGKEIGIGVSTLSQIVNHLEETYCQSVGVEYAYIRNPEVVKWIQEKMESTQNKPNFTIDEKKAIFKHLAKAVGFEAFIHKKFTGQKRFSLEGAESLIPALNAAIENGSRFEIEDFVIGMSHRGRLNVLSNVLQKPFENIFSEYNGKNYSQDNILGDVKYHLGYDIEYNTSEHKKIKIGLVPNPSHLETVSGVVQGIARAKLDHTYNKNENKVLPIIIHGDAAVAAQGIVYEVLQMSQLNGYRTGGTLHLVINNQVGFTTNYLDARSSIYSTDIGKVIKAPIFHVNGDDVEALVNTVITAIEYRQKFHTDIFIDILCYRKYGHNEGDEPRFTQPTLYKAIASHPNSRDIYANQLLNEKVLSETLIQQIQNEFNDLLENALTESKKNNSVVIKHFLSNIWAKYYASENKSLNDIVNTSVDKSTIREIAKSITSLPSDRKFFKKIEKLMDDRWQMIEANKLDWGMCELLAYGTLLKQGYPVRLSGQDSERGTFSHRHATLVIEDTDEKYIPLQNIDANQAGFCVYNSHLSEYGVLGFEYGYALAKPDAITIWEAQFGDFNNVAQVIIDQYLSSAREKWDLMNGVTLLLPHGYEGQGPEHSSARMERYLALCARNNMYVANCSTPANFFHILRRQVLNPTRMPLVIFTPKSLLRLPACISTIEDLSETNFQEIIDDIVSNPKQIKQIAFCSGKIYYELLEKRKEINNTETAIVRIEQLYPFPKEQITKIIEKYENATQLTWVQEEPLNMGAWTFLQRMLPEYTFRAIGRPESGSPATGLLEIHNKSQQKILDKTFVLCNCDLKTVYCKMNCMKDF